MENQQHNSTTDSPHIHRADWLRGQRDYEVVRLSAILRNPAAGPDEKQIAASMLAQYKNADLTAGGVQ